MVWTPPSWCGIMVVPSHNGTKWQPKEGGVMNNNNLIGLDIAKNVFEVCVQNAQGQVLKKKRLSRGSFVLDWKRLIPHLRN
jgi:hypothetical protein